MNFDTLHWILIALLILFVARVVDLMEILSMNNIKEPNLPEIWDGTDGY